MRESESVSGVAAANCMNLTWLRIGIRGMSRERSIKCFRAKTQRFDFHHATRVKIRLAQDLDKANYLTPRPPKLHAKAETCAERSQIYAERSRIYAERSRSSITLSPSLSSSHCQFLKKVDTFG